MHAYPSVGFCVRAYVRTRVCARIYVNPSLSVYGVKEN